MQNRKRDTDVQNRLLDSVGEGEGRMFREKITETIILSRVKHPGWMNGAGALGRPRGMARGGRWVGCSGWGTHVKSMADSCQCMAKTTTILQSN